MLHQRSPRTPLPFIRPTITKSHPHPPHIRHLATILNNADIPNTRGIPLPEQPVHPVELGGQDQHVSISVSSSNIGEPLVSDPLGDENRFFIPIDDSATPDDLFNVGPSTSIPHSFRFIKKDDPKCLLVFVAGYEFQRERGDGGGARPLENGPCDLDSSYDEEGKRAGYGIVHAPYVWTAPVAKRLEGCTKKTAVNSKLYTSGKQSQKSITSQPCAVNVTTTTTSALVPSPQTVLRATLRGVLISLSLRPWLSEGFRRIIIATSHKPLITGLRDCPSLRTHRWRDWRDVEVADRDLWEAMDTAVRDIETEGLGVQFWYLRDEEENVALLWAKIGAVSLCSP